MPFVPMKKVLAGFAGLFLSQSFSTAGIALPQNNPDTLASTSPVVVVDTGTLEGAQNKSIFSFKGIPFAAAPVRQWRWREPQAPAKWNGVRDAKKFGNACIQKPGLSDKNGGNPGSINEDCLFLNVWTPTLQPHGKLPVMVWIHGGGLLFDTVNDSMAASIL